MFNYTYDKLHGKLHGRLHGKLHRRLHGGLHGGLRGGLLAGLLWTVPHVFQLLVWPRSDLLSRLGDPAKTTKTSYKTSEIINLFLLLSLSNIENIRFESSTITPLFTT